MRQRFSKRFKDRVPRVRPLLVVGAVGVMVVTSACLSANADESPATDEADNLQLISKHIDDITGEDPSSADIQEAVKRLSQKDKNRLIEESRNSTTKLATLGSESGENFSQKELGNDFSVTVSTNDCVDSEVLSENTPTLASFTGNVTKKYGKRLYRVTTGLNYKGVGISNMCLVTHYTLGKSGMKVRYATTAGSYVIAGTINSSAKVTDASATKVGHNINSVGKYTVNYNVGTTLSFRREVHASVKIKSWNKSKKTMKLYETFTHEGF